MKTLAKTPVTIVTGFLGSGKTTLLRHMLDHAEGRRIAVIVNEFGELGIDGEILRQCSIGCTEEEAQGRVFELANGCLCCTVQEEFFPVMKELVARRGDIDHILIETTVQALRISGHWKACTRGLGRARPLVSMRIWSMSPRRATSSFITGKNSSCTVQHRQPLASS